MRRLRFVGQSLVNGLKWANGIVGILRSIVFVLALAGLAVVVRVTSLPTWAAVVIGYTLFLLVFAEGAYRTARGQSTMDTNSPLVSIYAKKFRNEAVPLDGFEYVECTFTNVTFVFNGTQRFSITGKTEIHGFDFDFSRCPPAVSAVLDLLYAFDFLQHGIIHNDDPTWAARIKKATWVDPISPDPPGAPPVPGVDPPPAAP